MATWHHLSEVCLQLHEIASCDAHIVEQDAGDSLVLVHFHLHI